MANTKEALRLTHLIQEKSVTDETALVQTTGSRAAHAAKNITARARLALQSQQPLLRAIHATRTRERTAVGRETGPIAATAGLAHLHSKETRGKQ
jgi:hypothetical protein